MDLEVQSPGAIRGLLQPVPVQVDDSIKADTLVVTTDTSFVTVENEEVTTESTTVNGVTRAAGEVVSYDLVVAAGAPNNLRITIRFDYETVGGSEFGCDKKATISRSCASP